MLTPDSPLHPAAHDDSGGHAPSSFDQLECCPTLEKCDTCDTLDIRYRLPFRPRLDRRQGLTVEVTLHFRLERCPGPLALGDILYTTTLLPGEQVRLFTSDRNSRFSFDKETNLAYRHETTSEESYFAAGMAHAMSDLDVVENVNKTSSFSESAVSGGGGAGLDLGFVEIGGSAAASSHDGRSASALARTLSQHAESSSRHVEVATRAASSTSVGEVATREHISTQSQDHFESASRVFSNPNRCHAISFFFYRINKCQTLRFTLVAVERRVVDPASPTGVSLNPPSRTGEVPVIPQGVVATSTDRLDIERRARASEVERRNSADVLRAAGLASIGDGSSQTLLASRLQTRAAAFVQEPIPVDVRQAALEQVDKDLVEAGLLEKVGGGVSESARERFGWTRTLVLPTPGVIVKGCLDNCSVCEPSLEQEIQLDLERKKLENALLQKQIDLLEKSQEYRGGGAGEGEMLPV